LDKYKPFINFFESEPEIEVDVFNLYCTLQ